MALTDYADYKAAQPYARVPLGKGSTTLVVSRLFSRWLALQSPGVAPTTAVAPDVSLVGSLPGTAGIATWIKSVQMGRTGGGTIMICDRLSHQGGLSGTVATAQTTNLPTAALTRFTSGVGVFAAIEISVAVGSTATSFTASYTNSAGTAGRTCPATPFGAAGDSNASRFFILPLQVGDVGVKSVESVTLAASTGTAGAFGVVLFKPLFAVPCFPINENAQFDTVRDMGCMFEPIPADAHLFQLFSALTTATFLTAGVANLIKQV